MIILGIFVVLAIIFTRLTVITTRDNTSSLDPLAWAIPTQILGAIFIVISVATPIQYKDIRLDAEYELSLFDVNGSYDVYATFDENTYVCYLNDGTNKPMTYPVDSVTSIVYIKEEETAKICKYVQETKWTWYAAPILGDKVSYILYIPEGSIFYGSK